MTNLHPGRTASLSHPRLGWAALVTLVGLTGCLTPAPYAILVVEDPEELATGAGTIAFGEDLDSLQTTELAGSTFPFDFLVYATEERTTTLWVEARNAADQALGRGRIEITLEAGAELRVEVELGYVCYRRGEGTERCAAEVDTTGADYTGVCVATDSCLVTTCQDEVVDPDNEWAELCDDGNGVDEDACRNDCQPNICGDGVRNPLEEFCDDGADNGTISTTVTFCGPDCDMGQLCGNGSIEGSEICDDGVDNGTVSLVDTYCGPLCGETQLCGNGVTEGSEACDDGAGVNGTISSTDTHCGPICEGTQLCANDLLEGTETCDDGNTTDADGCAAGCLVEAFYGCDGAPAICVDTIYVNAGGRGALLDGSSWEEPLLDLHAALVAAAAWAGPVDIWVAAGTYAATVADPSFGLLDDVALYGGFAGDERLRSERDPEATPSILSGAGIDSHLVIADGVGATAILDGFTITAGGQAGGALGSGMYVLNSTAVIRNCLFSANEEPGMRIENGGPTVLDSGFVNNDGTGLVNADAATLVRGCWFTDNAGSGIYNQFGGPLIAESFFAGNTATSNGGGMNNNLSSPTVVSCTFSGNAAPSFGGGMYNTGGDPTLTNCIFEGNTAVTGAGLYADDSFPVIANSLFYANQASANGGALSIRCAAACSTTSLVNSIVWGNIADVGGDQIDDEPNDPQLSVTYSCIEGGLTGTGNVACSATPLQDAAAGNFNLVAGSTCIDVGSNAAVPADAADLDDDGDLAEPTPYDHAGYPRFDGAGATVDIGPLEVHP